MVIIVSFKFQMINHDYLNGFVWSSLYTYQSFPLHKSKPFRMELRTVLICATKILGDFFERSSTMSIKNSGNKEGDSNLLGFKFSRRE